MREGAANPGRSKPPLPPSSSQVAFGRGLPSRQPASAAAGGEPPPPPPSLVRHASSAASTRSGGTQARYAARDLGVNHALREARRADAAEAGLSLTEVAELVGAPATPRPARPPHQQQQPAACLPAAACQPS
jgi:hypothetical protein